VQTAALSTTLESIADSVGIKLQPQSWLAVSGGDINQAGRLSDAEGRSWFIKLNHLDRVDMFAAECAGLGELAVVDDVYIPKAAGYGRSDQFAWLVLEWLDFAAISTAADQQLGRALARMHRVTTKSFGWHRDNYIGSTTQPNGWHASWPAFFRDQRLGHQFALAQSKGAPVSFIDSGQQLMAQLDNWFTNYSPLPSLLHGDLWGGNRGALADGSPLLFDPAVYFGDRETDIAMTRLFGGFGTEFYAAYVKEWPLAEGAAQRQGLYNLYHVLNHFNLFGGSYLIQAEQIVQQLLTE
jgi:protein-ribulosamine 3-kinase